MNSSNSPNSMLSTLEQTMQSIQEDFKIKYESYIADVVSFVRQNVQDTIREIAIQKLNNEHVTDILEVNIGFDKNIANKKFICNEACNILRAEFEDIEVFQFNWEYYIYISLRELGNV